MDYPLIKQHLTQGHPASHPITKVEEKPQH